MELLLLTATIRPSSYAGKTLKVEEREKQYEQALRFYLEKSDLDAIIFCDNSNSHLPNENSLSELAKILWKKLEIFSFAWDTEIVKSYGYGCGEAEIFDYVFENSKLLKQSDSFYKITGRYILENPNSIIKELETSENYFNKQWLFISPFTVSTAFFKISRELYEKCLYKKQIQLYTGLYQRQYKENYFFKGHFPIERAWYVLLRKELLKLQQKKSIPVLFEFPKVDTHWFSSIFRNFIYKIYCLIRLNQFWFLHKIVDSIWFNKIYKEALSDTTFPK